MLAPYYSEVSFDPAIPANAVAVVHNGGALAPPMYFRGFDLFGATDARVRVRIRRYPTKATDGTASAAYSFLDGAPASSVQILGDAVTWPVSEPNLDLTVRVATRATGGDNKPRGNIADSAITLLPDHTIVLETLDSDRTGPYTFIVYWGETLPSIPHIVNTALSASSAYTAAPYFNVPNGWTSITFAVTYTAHANSALGGRPAWRGSASNGLGDYAQPIVDMAIDALGKRLVYPMSDQWYALVPATETIRFTVSFDLMPGMPKVRLDIAEVGDVVNRGTVTVLVMGQ